MSLDFTPINFIHQADKELLGRFFTANELTWDLPWDELERGDTEEIERRWRELDDEVLAKVEVPMRRIWSLSKGNGNRLLVEEAELTGDPLPEAVKSSRFGINRAIWVWLENRAAFDLAWNCDRADQISSRMRHTRQGVPVTTPRLEAAALTALKESVAGYYWEHQGCGRRAHVQPYRKLNRYHLIYVFPEGYPDLFQGFDDDGEWTVREQRPAFQVLFTYDPVEGTLEICAPGIRDVQEDLEHFFAEHILGTTLPVEQPDRATYDLGRLLDPALCTFPVADGRLIVPGSVRLRKLRCSVRAANGGSAGIIGFESSARQQHQDIHTFIARFLDERRMPRSLLKVLSAELEAEYRLPQVTRGQSTKKLDWRLSGTDGCNLGTTPEELAIRQLLHTWEIARAEPAVAAAHQ